MPGFVREVAFAVEEEDELRAAKERRGHAHEPAVLSLAQALRRLVRSVPKLDELLVRREESIEARSVVERLLGG